jgi:O-glycosyl hydrolase
VIHNSLAVENVSAFLYWGLIWPSDSAGLIWVTYDAATKTPHFTLRDQYYALRHFARYTDPGYVRVDAAASLADVRISAYLSPDNSQLTIVLLNVGSSDANVRLDSLAGFSAPHTEAYRTIFRTGDAGVSEYWRQLEGFDVNQLFTMPSRSVVTVVMNSSIAADAAVADDAGS